MMQGDKAFIKIYRKFLQWEWYTDTNTKTLFLHCLLKANWKSGRWRGIQYEAGQFITSLPSLSKETGLTVRQVRTALNKLKSTGELADRVTGQNEPKGRVITVLNWDFYQDSDRINDRKHDRTATVLRQDDDRGATADKEYKKYKNNKEPEEIYRDALSRGPWGHVKLSQEEYDELVDQEGEEKTLAAIKVVDDYCEETGKTYKNYKLVIKRWGFDAVESKKLIEEQGTQRPVFQNILDQLGEN